MDDNAPLEVVIIGAGVAGLATAYGLKKAETQVRVRIFERRTCEQAFPRGRLQPDRLGSGGMSEWRLPDPPIQGPCETSLRFDRPTELANRRAVNP